MEPEPLDPFLALLGPVTADEAAQALELHREMLEHFAGLDRSDLTTEELEREQACEERARHWIACQEIALRAQRDGRAGAE